MTQNQKNNTSKFAEDWLPIKSISNGCIQLENGLLVTGIKITPKNIFILDYESQSNLIYNLRSFYNQINFEFWLIVADRPVDINSYIAELNLLYGQIQNFGIRKLLNEDIKKAEMFMSKEVNVVDTEYYLLFKEKKPDVISKSIKDLIINLSNCNMVATQTTDEDLRGLFDSLLNSNESTNYGVVMTNEQ